MKISRHIGKVLNRRDEIVVTLMALIIPFVTLPAMIG